MDTIRHILVAEDDSADAFFLQRALKRAGVPVTLCFVRDGQEAIDYLQGDGSFADRTLHPSPDLLLLDLKMPKVNGFEVLAWVRKQPRLQGMEVIVFSSSNAPKDISRAYELGANSYLVKPHSIEDLMQLVGHFKRHWLDHGKNPNRQAA